MFVNDLLSDEEAKACATPSLGTEEPVKEVLLHLIGHPTSVICYFNEDGFAGLGIGFQPGLYCDLPGFGGS